jgi:hypothetical protein
MSLGKGGEGNNTACLLAWRFCCPVLAVLLFGVSVQSVKVKVKQSQSGYGGLVISMLASGTQDREFEPGRSRRIFRV